MREDGAIERARRLHAQRVLEEQQRAFGVQQRHWWRCPNCGNPATGSGCNNCGWCGGIVRAGTPLPPEPPLVVTIPSTLQASVPTPPPAVVGAPPVTPRAPDSRELATTAERAAAEARARISVLEREIANLRADMALMTSDAVEDRLAQIHAKVKEQLR